VIAAKTIAALAGVTGTPPPFLPDPGSVLIIATACALFGESLIRWFL
jgi:hypothetical protein